MLPIDGAHDLFFLKPPEPPVNKFYTIRPYVSADEVGFVLCAPLHIFTFLSYSSLRTLNIHATKYSYHFSSSDYSMSVFWCFSTLSFRMANYEQHLIKLKIGWVWVWCFIYLYIFACCFCGRVSSPPPLISLPDIKKKYQKGKSQWISCDFILIIILKIRK